MAASDIFQSILDTANQIVQAPVTQTVTQMLTKQQTAAAVNGGTLPPPENVSAGTAAASQSSWWASIPLEYKIGGAAAAGLVLVLLFMRGSGRGR